MRWPGATRDLGKYPDPLQTSFVKAHLEMYKASVADE